MAITLIVITIVGTSSGAAYATSIGLTLSIPALMFWALVQLLNWITETVFRGRLSLMLATMATAIVLISVYGPTGFWHRVQHGMGHVAIGIANLWTNPGNPDEDVVATVDGANPALKEKNAGVNPARKDTKRCGKLDHIVVQKGSPPLRASFFTVNSLNHGVVMGHESNGVFLQGKGAQNVYAGDVFCLPKGYDTDPSVWDEQSAQEDTRRNSRNFPGYPD
jgi:hypothetical protein